jgi:hypothetical protein
MINKFFISLKSAGFKITFKKVFFKILYYLSFKNYIKKKNKKKILEIRSVEEKFSKIYSTNYWSDNESKSGTGSSLKSTENIRVHLPKILEKFSIKKLFDAPCGDFNWMFHVLQNTEIEYLGSDIVTDLIILNKKKYENNKIKFSKLDIRIDKLPKFDLMICRDTLFHFSYNDIFLFFNNFLSSKIKYILLTSHLNSEYKFENKDITTGDFRKICFFSKPFNFEKSFLYNFDDRDRFDFKNFKQMYLFSKSQIENNLKKNPQKFLSEGL